MRRRLVLITGASSGIGEELARQFVDDGCDVVLVARSTKKLHSLADTLEAKGARAWVLACDLALPGGANAVFQFTEANDLEVDVLVNNAGVGTYGAFVSIDVEEQLQLVRLNIEALTHLTALYLPKMVARKSGQILQVGSTAAFQPGPLMATYYASKAYVVSFTEALAVELEGTGVSVSVLCPGPVLTGFQASAKMEHSKLTDLGVARVEDVARIGRQALARKKTVAIVGFANKVLVFFSTRVAPRWLTPRIVKRIQAAR